MSRDHECKYDSDGGPCRICGKTVAEQIGSLALVTGYAATPDEIWACRAAAVAGWCGEPCNNSYEEMKALESKGLVKNLELLAGRGRYAGRYEYEMTAAGEAVAEAYLELLPKVWPHIARMSDRC